MPELVTLIAGQTPVLPSVHKSLSLTQVEVVQNLMSSNNCISKN